MKLLGIDTNVVIRLLLDDDPVQRTAALQFGKGLGKDYNAFLSVIAILELDWALRAKYRFSRKDVAFAVNKLLHTRGLVVEYHHLVIKALRMVELDNADLADALIACRSLEEGCEAVKTFDLKAARRVPGMELLT